MRRQVEDLAPPPWGVRGFSYSRLVQPVWDRRAVFAWLDLNCPYYSSSDSTYRANVFADTHATEYRKLTGW